MRRHKARPLPRSRNRTATDRERIWNAGSVLLESALTLLVFITTVIGIADVAQVLFLRSSVYERARAAARYGAVHFDDFDKIRNVALYNQATAPTGGQPMLGMTAGMVQVARDGAGTSSDRITVYISGYPLHLFTPFLARTISSSTIVVTVPVESM